MTKSNLVVFAQPGEVELRTVELGEPGPGEIALRTLYSLVSTGTELRVLAGHYGSVGKFPLVPGYSLVARVEAVGPEVTHLRTGDLVSCGNMPAKPGFEAMWGAQGSYHICSAAGPLLLPEGAAPLDYAFVEIGAIPLRGAVMAQPKPGETVVVIGQGLIGALSAKWFTLHQTRVIVVDISPERGRKAIDRGAFAFVDGRDPAVVDRVKAYCPSGADVVVEASGSVPGIELASKLLNPAGGWTDGTPQGGWPRLVLQANYLGEVTHNLFNAFPGEGLTMLTPWDRRATDRQAVLTHIAAGRFKSAEFVDKIVPWDQAPQAYQALRDRPDQHFSLIFDWTL